MFCGNQTFVGQPGSVRLHYFEGRDPGKKGSWHPVVWRHMWILNTSSKTMLWGGSAQSISDFLEMSKPNPVLYRVPVRMTGEYLRWLWELSWAMLTGAKKTENKPKPQRDKNVIELLEKSRIILQSGLCGNFELKRGRNPGYAPHTPPPPPTQHDYYPSTSWFWGLVKRGACNP